MICQSTMIEELSEQAETSLFAVGPCCVIFVLNFIRIVHVEDNVSLIVELTLITTTDKVYIRSSYPVNYSGSQCVYILKAKMWKLFIFILYLSGNNDRGKSIYIANIIHFPVRRSRGLAAGERSIQLFIIFQVFEIRFMVRQLLLLLYVNF